MPSIDRPRAAPNEVTTGRLRHYGGFVLGGVLALTTDASILELLIRMGWNPLVARPIGIAVAMVVSWFVNRTITYAVPERPTFAEFGRFAAVSWTAQAVNYAVFSGILMAVSDIPPITALLIACLAAMFVSYFGFRHAVFAQTKSRLTMRRP